MTNSLEIPNKSFLCYIRLEFSFSLRNYIVVHSFQSFILGGEKKVKAKDEKNPFC